MLSPLNIFLLGAFGTARKQDDDLCARLCLTDMGVIQTPTRAEVDAQLNHPTANALKSPSKPKQRRLIRSTTAPRTRLSFNPSSHE